MADSYHIMAWYGWYQKEEGFEKGKQYAQKALSLNPDLPEANTALGSIATYHDMDWEFAEREILLALSLNPNYGTAHPFYYDLLDIPGRHEEAREHLNLAIKLDKITQLGVTVDAMS